MSEFKFACPVCGQHITADSSTSGGQLDCPTCFRRIVVPQAPSALETKLILSASQAGKPRPAMAPGSDLKQGASRSRRPVWVSVTLMAVLCAAAAALGMAGRKAIELISAGKPVPTTSAGAGSEVLPAEVQWTLDLRKAVVPEGAAAGTIHGAAFVCEKAILEGAHLSLRQGRGERPYARIGISLYAREPGDLSGKSIEVTAERKPPLPQIILKWRDEHHQSARHEFNSGYAMKLSFGAPANGRMPGKIYVCLPDDSRSVVAGSFEAEIRNPKTAEAKPRPPGGTAGGKQRQ